ncbi:hypothetical protein DPMN_076045 [Dreissena polymorpha]|uniref:Uncharacterized protein n=1 Tax=Dreissena polymorpha TaxID=45954 RepID=A0A9D3YI04_DREPO|nr:hypothetical protein DPMN_076045 [Dreissena polymorpha]
MSLCVVGRWPVELSIEVKAVPVLQFPSVTICNINPLKKDNMRSGPFQEKSAVFTLGKDDMIYDGYSDDLMNEMTCKKFNYMLFYDYKYDPVDEIAVRQTCNMTT